MRLVLTAATVLLITASPVSAQTTTSPTWLEAGLGAAAYGPSHGDTVPTLHLRGNFSPQVAADWVAAFVTMTPGFHRLQVRIARTQRAQPSTGFFTLGMLGELRINRLVPEVRFTRSTGEVVVRPAYRYSRLGGPIGFGGGGGVRIGAGSRMALDVGGQVWLLGDGLLLMLDAALSIGAGPRR